MRSFYVWISLFEEHINEKICVGNCRIKEGENVITMKELWKVNVRIDKNYQVIKPYHLRNFPNKTEQRVRWWRLPFFGQLLAHKLKPHFLVFTRISKSPAVIIAFSKFNLWVVGIVDSFANFVSGQEIEWSACHSRKFARWN